MNEKTEDIVAQIYAMYGSHTGHLFGITPELKGAVRGIVSATIEILDEDE